MDERVKRDTFGTEENDTALISLATIVDLQREWVCVKVKKCSTSTIS